MNLFLSKVYRFAKKLLASFAKSPYFFFILLALPLAFFSNKTIQNIAQKASEVVKDAAEPYTNKAKANYSFQVTGGQLVVGTETTITSGASSGNVGSWKGTYNNDQ